jgi:hypothetical protein
MFDVPRSTIAFVPIHRKNSKSPDRQRYRDWERCKEVLLDFTSKYESQA